MRCQTDIVTAKDLSQADCFSRDLLREIAEESANTAAHTPPRILSIECVGFEPRSLVDEGYVAMPADEYGLPEPPDGYEN